MSDAAKRLPLDDEDQAHGDGARETGGDEFVAPPPAANGDHAAESVTPEAGLLLGEQAALLEAVRIAEALVFAAAAPIDESEIARRLPEGMKVAAVMAELRSHYEGRGVNLVRAGRKWTFRTAADRSWLLSRETQQQKKLSRAALETLAIIAYHQPTTRAEIEDIRGVAISKGTLDVLMETGWVRLRGRRKAPGRPVTYGTTDDFLLHFGLESVSDLPGLDELKGAGLFDGRLPPGFGVPKPNDSVELTEDEDPLEEGDLLDFVLGEDEAEAVVAETAAEPAPE